MQYQELWHAKLHVAEGGGETTLSQTVFCLANIWGCTELAFYLGGLIYCLCRSLGCGFV